MIHPALIRELRNVLDEYPDDGQIFKVDRTILLFNSISCNIARKWCLPRCLSVSLNEPELQPLENKVFEFSLSLSLSLSLARARARSISLSLCFVIYYSLVA